MFPSADTSLLAGGALLLQVALLAIRTPVFVQQQPTFDSGKAPDHPISRRTNVFILRCIVDEVGPIKTFVFGNSE
jgi:hypothetical protein